MNKLKYRKEITSLRFFAIIPVLLYHFDASLITSGYLGVDIFFVISGYLISHKILYDIYYGQFSFKKFYNSRFKRLVPALVFLVLTINLIVFNFYTTSQLKEVYLTAIYSIFYLSNIYFLNNTGYFDTSIESQLYLHTWSLSIEEQFYLFMPLVLLLVMKKIKMKVFTVFIIFCTSLLSTILLPLRYIDFKFYLLPFRMWEFLLGTLVAFYLLKNDKKIKLSNSISFFLLIGLCTQFFIPFNILNHPGIATFITCLITATLLVTLKDANKLNKILNLKVFYFIGLISYSLYLWHDPLIKLNRELDIFINDAVLLSIILAVSSFSYYFVENFFRYRSSNKLFYIVSFVVMTLIISMFIYQNNQENIIKLSNVEVGNIEREIIISTPTTLKTEQDKNNTTLEREIIIPTPTTLKTEQDKNNTTLEKYENKLLFKEMFGKYFNNKKIKAEGVNYDLSVGGTGNFSENVCFITGNGYVPDKNSCLKNYDPSKTNILFLGDSTAHNYFIGFKNVLEMNNYDNYSLHVLGVTACVPLIDNYDQNIKFTGKEEKCEASYKSINKILEETQFDLVFFSYRYKYFYESDIKPFIPTNSYSMFEKKLIELSKKTKLIVIGPSLLYKEKAWEVHKEILQSTGELYIFNNSDIDNTIFEINKKLDNRLTDQKITYVSLLNYLCEDQYCLSYIEINSVLYPILRDTIHHTLPASEFIAENLLIKFSNLNK